MVADDAADNGRASCRPGALAMMSLKQNSGPRWEELQRKARKRQEADDEKLPIETPLSNFPSTPSGRKPKPSVPEKAIAETAAPPAIKGDVVDKDAIEIGEIYLRIRAAFIDMAHAQIECGRKLAAKRSSLSHGQWLPWLQANAEVPGFPSVRTAQRLIKVAEANAELTTHLDEAAAMQINRLAWGNAPRLAAAAGNDDKGEQPSPLDQMRRRYLELFAKADFDAELEALQDGLREIARAQGKELPW
jgi:hypothetical protein